MNQELLRQRAEELNLLLSHYAQVNEDAKALLNALSAYIQNALSGMVLSPVEWKSIPGDRMFDEGKFRELPQLERAFSDFKVEMTGGETPVLKKLRMEFEAKNKRKQ